MNAYKEIVGSIEALSRWDSSGDTVQALSKDEAYWSLPEGMGRGYLSVMRLRPGLIMAFTDFEFTTRISGDFDFSTQYISFTYSVAGEFSMLKTREGTPLYSCRNGYEILASFPKGSTHAVTPCPEAFKCVSIYLAPSIFFDVFPGMEGYVQSDLREIIQGDPGRIFYQELPATVNVQMAIQEILNCPYNGPYRQLFMQSKAMELMTHTLWRSRQQTLGADNVGLRPGDAERVNNAKKIMDMNFREDIKLLDLARRVGLPHTKLNQYFRRIYGTTVFGYLRELRMTEARFLLSRGDANVTEAAYSVGYSSLSHFAKVFKKYCGQAPGDFMRNASGRS